MALLLRLNLITVLMTLTGCSGLFFYPQTEWVQNPARQGLDYEDVILIHKDGLRLHGWWLPAATDSPKGTVYFLHGNAQNISTHLMNVHWLPERGYQVFLLDYRGYGLSEGKARLPGAIEDAQLGLDWLSRSQRVQGPLVVFGQSLGGAIAAGIMGRGQNRGKGDCVILEAAFTGYRDIMKEIMGNSWLLWPFSFVAPSLVPDQDRPIDRVAGISPRPLLILHSREDQVIPFHHGESLYQAASEPKLFQPLKGGHTESTQAEDVRERLLAFMEECG
ncbi:MAG: alpha/beta hydrolase [Oleiphilaceae bacterium]|nr:alpha/beta hydrolase [Oleiphilaceae bacterium]